MKTLSLVVGLVQLLASALLAHAGLHSESVTLILLYAAGAFINSCLGTAAVMDALFGDGGLVLDIGRRVELSSVREDRAVSPRKRSRVTHPSPALRKRGALRRWRDPRVPGRMRPCRFQD